MKINRKKFYTEYRKVYGKLTQKQVDSIECIFNEIEASDITDIRWVEFLNNPEENNCVQKST